VLERSIAKSGLPKLLTRGMDVEGTCPCWQNAQENNGSEGIGSKDDVDEDELCLLAFVIEERGQNLSAGIKQLICLIRALLRKSKVVVMDEPTSAIDAVTEQAIWHVVNDEFSQGVTVLTIAHRVNSILQNEEVLVMERGSVVESGSLDELEADPKSALNELLAQKTHIEKLEKALASDDEALSFDGFSEEEEDGPNTDF